MKAPSRTFMNSICKMIVVSCTKLLFGLVLFSTRVAAQTDKLTSKLSALPGPPMFLLPEEPFRDPSYNDIDFVFPTKTDDTVDSFIYRDEEYLFVEDLAMYEAASKKCQKTYYGRLATIQDLEVANFLAEALSETRLIMDSLWIGGQRGNGSTDDWMWKWPADSSFEDVAISKEIKDTFKVSNDVPTDDRHCLAFGRSNHESPQFRPLVCQAYRSMMCQRSRGGGPDSYSTHPGWIRIKNRLYKIFVAQYNYTEAEQACTDYDRAAELAIITSFKDAQYLGRYLLIGRPSLENAWIGARYQNYSYYFATEELILANETNSEGYPPWRNQTIQKAGGCVLLDRHVANTTLFVEARCQRYRSYICYKIATNETEPYVDIIIGNFGYRLHLFAKNWLDAVDHCLTRYADYSAKLAEIDAKEEINNLLYVMGENKTAVQHIWLGGTYTYDSTNHPEWRWQSNQQKIVSLEDYNFIINDTYTESVEIMNNCLNMDRENHLVAMLYGTDCECLQFFVCSFSAADLQRLIKDERENATRAFS